MARARSSSPRRCRRTIPSSQRARELGIPVIRRAEALGEAVSGGRARGDRRHARQDDDDRDDHRRRSPRPAASRPALVGGRVAAWGGNLRVRRRSTVRRRGGRVRSVVPRAHADGRRGHEHRGRPSRHLRRSRRHQARVRAVRVAARERSCSAPTTRARTRLPTPSSRRGHSLRHRRRPTRGCVARDVRDSNGGGSRFDVVYDDEMLGDVELAVPGRAQRAERARRASRSGLALGATVDGDARRARGVRAASSAASSGSAKRAASTVVDDYAHHPDRDRGDAGRGARRVSRPPDRRRIPAAPLLAHARFRARVRRRAGRGGRGVPHRDLSGARAADRGRDRRRSSSTRLRDAGGALAWRGERGALAERARALRCETATSSSRSAPATSRRPDPSCSSASARARERDARADATRLE